MVVREWLWWFGVLLAAISISVANGANVTYDGRSLIIDGKRQLLFSGSIHYPRSTPDMWSSLISKAKSGGLNAIATYVFWNLHEPTPGQLDFRTRDIVRFIKEVQAQGLYVFLRIGPFIAAEWSYGGFPFWLHDVPNIVFRSDNEPFKLHMKQFTKRIVTLMKSEKLFASQGGPIILSQIENEYQNIENRLRARGPPYVIWAAKLAVGLKTGIPWVMCKQDDAPDPMINTCNGQRCGETFVGPNSPKKPALWTENWTHNYDIYGNDTRIRTAENIAYHVALFIAAKNGSFINYYMYHGGTNFGRTGSAFVLTKYYDPAPLDEYAKMGCLKELHATVNLCSQTLLYGVHTNFSLGSQQEAYVYRGHSGECAAFLVNTDGSNNATVQFLNATYQLPPKSISILSDCQSVTFNTAKVSAQVSTRSTEIAVKLDSPDKWQEFNEVVPVHNETSMRSSRLLEQINTTKDASNYLWYTTSYEKLNNSEVVLVVESLGHVLRVFVNDEILGSMHGTKRNPSFTLETNVTLGTGANNISLLSNMVGLPNSGAFLERRGAGLTSVSIRENNVIRNLTSYTWGYQVGLLGEKLQLYTDEGAKSPQWRNFNTSSKPLTWYKSKFDEPEGSDHVVLNIGSMGKGEAWINGQSIGRYWISFVKPGGSPSQTRYHIPRSFLKHTDNMLVLFEEETGDPLRISVETVTQSIFKRLVD